MDDDKDSIYSTDDDFDSSNSATDLLEQYLHDLGEYLTFQDCAKIGTLLRKARNPIEWSDNPKLYYLLWKIGQVNLFSELLDRGITDLWIPFTKRTLQLVLKNEDVKQFLTCQEACLYDHFLGDEDPLQLPGRHLSLDDADSLELEELKLLGHGGLAEVHSVRYKTGV
ncbi:hypothetical protein M3J09_007624 [Ascochyta lentis]